MKYIYAPGCALMLYDRELAELLKKEIEKRYTLADTRYMCCLDAEAPGKDTAIITTCTYCHTHYRTIQPDAPHVFFLEDLAESGDFDFPDYGGAEMSIHDTCSGRADDRYLNTVRKLLQRMNIRVAEPERSGKRGICCGSSLYGKLPIEKVTEFMKKRADQMPCEDVVVYCPTCVQSIAIGGKRPRYILDLLFGRETSPSVGSSDSIDEWKKDLGKYREENR